MHVTFLIATFSNRIRAIPRILLRQEKSISYIVVAQNISDKLRSEFLTHISNRTDVDVYFTSDTGVTKSRNLAINSVHRHTDVVYFLDDDIKLEEDSYRKIVTSFEETGWDCITFCAASLRDSSLLKKYWKKQFLHSKLSILKVGTIEIAVNAMVLRENKSLRFPESMGAGSNYPQCDEPVFLSRLMNYGCKVGYTPKVTIYHPEESSGKSLSSPSSLMARGLAFREIFGVLGPVVNVLFFLKSFNKIKYNRLAAFKDLFRGSRIWPPN